MTTANTSFHAHFAQMIADGDYDRLRSSEKRKVRKQERTVARRVTRAAVEAHFAGDLA